MTLLYIAQSKSSFFSQSKSIASLQELLLAVQSSYQPPHYHVPPYPPPSIYSFGKNIGVFFFHS